MAQKTNLARFSSRAGQDYLAQVAEEHLAIAATLDGESLDRLAALRPVHTQPSRQRYLERWRRTSAG